MPGSLSGTIADVFRQDEFSNVSLSELVQRNPFNPTGIGALDLFTPLPVRTKGVAIEQMQGKLMIIPTSPRGAPPTPRITEKRQGRVFTAPRLAHDDTLYYAELAGIRAYNDQTVFMQAQDEVARRLSGPTGLQANMEYTRERHRLGAVQGIVRDADDTIIYNWFNEFNITPPAEVVFNLGAQLTNTLRPILNTIVRGMERAGQGAILQGTPIIAICGDAFYDAFVNHVDVVKTFLNYPAAATLRDPTAFRAFEFEGVTFINYRGSDDQSTISIASNKAHFVAKSPGLFMEVLTPADEFEPWVNTPGEKEYTISFEDIDRHAWRKFELYSYPLFVCTRPETLYVATMDAMAD